MRESHTERSVVVCAQVSILRCLTPQYIVSQIFRKVAFNHRLRRGGHWPPVIHKGSNMKLTHVRLSQARNYPGQELALGGGVNILYGDNAQGKTNFLECVYFCATGRLLRAGTAKDLIMHGSDEASITVKFTGDFATLPGKVDIRLSKDAGKAAAVNGLPVKRLSELFGVLLTVAFCPEDLNIISSGPEKRRRFMDMELCQTSAVYCHNLAQYYRVLKQRNALLKRILKSRDDKTVIAPWDGQLCHYGIKIINQRKFFSEKISGLACKICGEITGGKDLLEIRYRANADAGEMPERLIKDIERDVILGSTQHGPHKDDLAFIINGRDARIYGSQGQKRTAAISAKLAEVEMIREERGEYPVLLLDDVFSELDANRQNELVTRIAGVQTLLTCTGMDDAASRFADSRAGAAVYKVENGRILC